MISNVFAKTLRGVLIGIIKIYQLMISPVLGPRCRFQPSCSDYMIDSIKAFGVFKGGALGLKRFTKCHPLSGKSGYDPVPDNTIKAPDVDGSSHPRE